MEKTIARGIGFLVAVLLLCLLVFFWPFPAMGNPPEPQPPQQRPYRPESLTREVRYSENFSEDVKAAIESLKEEYTRYGCLGGSITGYQKPDDPNTIVYVAVCMHWPDETKGR